jgi:hypothetical protein
MSSELCFHNIKSDALRDKINLGQKNKKLAAATLALNPYFEVLSCHNHCEWEAGQ